MGRASTKPSGRGGSGMGKEQQRGQRTSAEHLREQAAGDEVREVGEGQVMMVLQGGQPYPGLTKTVAFIYSYWSVILINSTPHHSQECPC